MFNLKAAHDLMRTKLVTLTAEAKVVDGVTHLLKHRISGAPVVDSQHNYLGMFSEKCCLNALTQTLELACELHKQIPKVEQFMTTSLVTLEPTDDVFLAIEKLLARQISGAPVLDGEGNFLGVFSEKTAMQVLLAAAYDQCPGTRIEAYMNTDSRRIIDAQDTLIDVAHRFQTTSLRRLTVLRGGKLIGQVSRRDVLAAEHRIERQVASAARRNGADERLKQCSCNAEIGKYMDRQARTIEPSTDWLEVAQVFLTTPYRRLAVIDKGKLVGQVSRRDLLSAASALLRPTAERHKPETLYLSPIADSMPPSL